MEVLNIFFKNESLLFKLNRSESKTLQISIQSMYPSLKLTFELRAVQHNCSVKFEKSSWDAIVDNAENIKETLLEENEKTIFINHELKIFTEKMHDRCAVCFFDQRRVRVNMMRETFRKMMQLSNDVATQYKKIYAKVNETAQNLKLFVDVILMQSNQQDPRQLNTYLNELQQHINDQCEIMDESLPKVCDYYDEDEDESGADDYYRRRDRFGFDNSDDDDDDDDLDDDDDDHLDEDDGDMDEDNW